MTAPKRIQLRRTKGWRKPEGCIVVARPSQWGNPWRVGETVGCDIDEPDMYRGSSAIVTPSLAVELYRSALLAPPIYKLRDGRRIVTGLASCVSVETAVIELASHDLGCWCPLDQPCHADVLLEIANQ